MTGSGASLTLTLPRGLLNLILRFKNKVQFSACVDTFEFAFFGAPTAANSCSSHACQHGLIWASINFNI